MYPAVRELKKEYGTKVTFVIADLRYDESLQLAAIYGVRYVPDFVVVNALGQVSAREVGAMPKADLQALIEQGLGQ